MPLPRQDALHPKLDPRIVPDQIPQLRICILCNSSDGPGDDDRIFFTQILHTIAHSFPTLAIWRAPIARLLRDLGFLVQISVLAASSRRLRRVMSRVLAITWNVAFANSMLVNSPMPLEAPVTTATRSGFFRDGASAMCSTQALAKLRADVIRSRVETRTGEKNHSRSDLAHRGIL
jgi:hypothetical protein